MMLFRYLFTSILVALFLAACSNRSFHAEWAQTPVHPIRGELKGQSCELSTDDSGLIHVKAGGSLSAFACFGLVHGQHRAFQMDYLRRAGQGRLAEILGPSSVKTDFFLRLIGLAEKAKALVAKLSPEELRYLIAYSEGVNRGFSIAVTARAYEFRRLGYEPEPWRPEDTLTVLLLQSFSETQDTFWQQMKEENWRSRLGGDAESLARRDGLPWDRSILQAAELPHATPSPKKSERAPGRNVRDGFLFPAPPLDLPEETGSNSWILSPRRSATGRAWLANDPHLELTHPSFWHWIHLTGGEMDVVGASVPGVPIFASGLNRYVAWGLTNSYVQVGEVVSIPETDTAQFQSERPTIWVKLGPVRLPFFFKTMRRSPEGWPVLPLDSPPGRALILRWTGLMVSSPGLSGFGKLLTSRSVAEADTFFAQIELPTWNFVFADTAGNIGYRVVGLVPRQTKAPAFGVRDARLSELDRANWTLLSNDEKPHALNPTRGWLVTANNRPWPQEAALHLGRGQRDGFRAYRIEEMLGAREKHDAESQQNIQCDTQAVNATFVVPKLIALARGGTSKPSRWGEREERAIAALAGWDFSAPITCRACSVFERWLDRISEDLNLDTAALYRTLDTPAKYGAQILQALPDALDDLGVKGKAEFPAWGDRHRAFFPHVSRAERFEERDSLATPGNPTSVNPGGKKWQGNLYRHGVGASLRLLVEMTDPPTARFAMAGPNEDAELKQVSRTDGRWVEWRDCRYRPLAFPFDWSRAHTEKTSIVETAGQSSLSN